MAVQAQYPSHILLLNRNTSESKNTILGNADYTLQPQPGGGGGYLDQSQMFLHSNGVGVNPRKRSTEVAATPTTTTTRNSYNFSLQNHQQQQHNNEQNQQQLINLSQLQNHQQQQQPHPSVVSTGLKLSFGEPNQQIQQQQQQQQIQQQPKLLSHLSEEFSLQFKQQSDELNYFLHAQGQQLRRTLAEKRQRHYRVLLGAAEETVARRMQEKEAEVEKAVRRNAELEASAAQLREEAQAWKAKAQAQEAQAVSLQAQLQQAMVGGGPNNVGGSLQQDREGSGLGCAGDVEDAESAYVDPVNERVNPPCCKACQTRPVSVVLLPCRHLCLCMECDDVVQACPVCFSLRSASVEVYLT